MLVGAFDDTTNPTGTAYLYNAADTTYIGPELKPFYDDGSGMADHPDINGFGVAASIISEGHYTVGSVSTDSLLERYMYNFRQRGPEWTVQTTITPDALPTAKLGGSVAIDGNTAIVGAQDYDGRGAAFVYTFDAGAGKWFEQARLQVHAIDLGADFGAGVALSGDTAVIGAPGIGTAYVFERLGDAWSLEATLAGSGDFGAAVAIDIDILAIGAPLNDEVSIYQLVADTWTFATTLSGSGEFGSSVAVDSGLVAIGAPSSAADATNGSVFVYEDTGSWTLQDTLNATAGGDQDEFGQSVDLSGGNLIVGAPGNNAGAGAAYLFTLSASTWTEQQVLTLTTGLADDHFGFSVAVDGNRAVVGAYGRDPTDDNEGQAYAYRLKNGQWILESGIEGGGDTGAGDQLGYAVDISGSKAVLGTPQFDGRPGTDTSGAGYAFVRNVEPPVNVTVSELQQTLINGAQANRLTGSVGGQTTSDLSFFDIEDVSVTGSALADTLQIASAGLTALGLLNFDVAHGAEQRG